MAVNTWTEIRAAFRDITGDTDANIFSAETAVRWANLGLRDLCDAARYVDSQHVVSTASGTGTYGIAAGGYDVFRVEYDDCALLPITRDQLRNHGRDWASRSGTPRFYYLTEMSATPDYLYVGLWEKPPSLTNGLRIWYHGYPTDVSDSTPSSEIVVPDWAVGGVLFYMLIQAYTADTVVRDLGAADLYQMMYDDLKERLVDRSRDRQSRKEWQAGSPAGPSLNVLNRLPDRVTP